MPAKVYLKKAAGKKGRPVSLDGTNKALMWYHFLDSHTLFIYSLEILCCLFIHLQHSALFIYIHSYLYIGVLCPCLNTLFINMSHISGIRWPIKLFFHTGLCQSSCQSSCQSLTFSGKKSPLFALIDIDQKQAFYLTRITLLDFGKVFTEIANYSIFESFSGVISISSKPPLK